MLTGDSAELRKARGAFFTPYPIAQFLANWALGGGRHSLLDPTCGEGVFLVAGAEVGSAQNRFVDLYGADIHQASLDEAVRLLRDQEHMAATLVSGDFFDESSPYQIGARLPLVDAVVGNPPFVRFQEHRGRVRTRAASAALAQGVRVSGLASSWAPLVVHASSFLKPNGRLAMVLPAELLSVGYAEPIRQWLRQRFKTVHLVLFNRLQFADAEAQVLLLMAEGEGGCSTFTLHEVSDAAELSSLDLSTATSFVPSESGKWTDLLIPDDIRDMLRSATKRFQELGEWGRVELGTVTGSNKFFTLSEETRLKYGLVEDKHVRRTVPPGSRHVAGLNFAQTDWDTLKNNGERVWLLDPVDDVRLAGRFKQYLDLGEATGIHLGYKCSGRSTWWRPPVQAVPNMFFTYMNHRAPRLIKNEAKVHYVNSLHGFTFGSRTAKATRDALPFLAMNTLSMLSAELAGRAYGGGILKLEPREAMRMLVPGPAALNDAWASLSPNRKSMEQLARERDWSALTSLVDDALLVRVLGTTERELGELRQTLAAQRARRQGRELSYGAR